MLRDPERTDTYPELLSLLVALSIAPGESLSILCESRAVFPTLVMWLHDLCTPIWEEDDALLSDASAMDKYVRLVCVPVIYMLLMSRYRTVHLIMVITLLIQKLTVLLDSDLKAKLAAYRQTMSNQYIGIGHMLSVTLSRLSYAEVPEEMQRENRRRMADVGGSWLFMILELSAD